MTAILIGGGGEGKEDICQGTVRKEAVHELQPDAGIPSGICLA
jgi:hypothetical protein